MRTPLLSDDVYGAQEEDGPDDVVEHHQAKERHEDPEGDAHHLEDNTHKYWHNLETDEVIGPPESYRSLPKVKDVQSDWVMEQRSPTVHTYLDIQ